MNEERVALPKAKIEKSRLGWFLWLIPIAAALLCVWYVCCDIIFAGPVITIYFQNAAGLQEQNSLVRYRGVRIGEVETLKLTKDRQRVAVKARLDPSALSIARQGSIFWIVRPELKLGSVSGLQTIVSGDYVTVQPGNGARTNLFIGAEKEPVEPIKALDIILLAPRLGSLQPQSPVFYRDIQVGDVLDCRLSDDARAVVIRARILEEYAPLVRINSKFWNAGGINFHFGLFSGVNISAESAQTLISGGIAFATPPDFQSAVTNGAVFILNEKSKDEWEKWSPAIPLPSMPEAIINKPFLPNLIPR
ncbi:MAG: MlaD family protein [Verrucomicrobiota bacterium]|jgi:paraquat-inducible protein B